MVSPQDQGWYFWFKGNISFWWWRWSNSYRSWFWFMLRLRFYYRFDWNNWLGCGFR